MGNRIGSWTTLVLVLSAGPAGAGLLPTNPDVGKDGENYRYSYKVTVQPGSVLQRGDYFTVYDFAGFVPGSTSQPSGFAFSSATTGPTPGRLTPDDDPAVPNLTWTYTGSGLAANDLGAFSAISRYGMTTDDAFTGQSHREMGGHLNNNITDTRVPVPVAPCVPEPATLLLLALGAPFVLAVRRSRGLHG